MEEEDEWQERSVSFRFDGEMPTLVVDGPIPTTTTETTTNRFRTSSSIFQSAVERGRHRANLEEPSSTFEPAGDDNDDDNLDGMEFGTVTRARTESSTGTLATAALFGRPLFGGSETTGEDGKESNDGKNRRRKNHGSACGCCLAVLLLLLAAVAITTSVCLATSSCSSSSWRGGSITDPPATSAAAAAASPAIAPSSDTLSTNSIKDDKFARPSKSPVAIMPTQSPNGKPTKSPTTSPPTVAPTKSPTSPPTVAPTKSPTIAPSAPTLPGWLDWIPGLSR